MRFCEWRLSMSELNSESGQERAPQKRGSGVAIAAIIAATIVVLACIAASTVVVYVFLQNAPW
jgi:hypothetical protein